MVASDRAPSIRDVAKLAGVSSQTVSRVVGGLTNVRPETREKVRIAMAELHYRPNHAARSLAIGRSETIGVLSTQLSQYGPSRCVRAIDRHARAAGYLVNIVSLPDATAAHIDAGVMQLQRQLVEGVIVVTSEVAVVEKIARSPITVPFVTVHSAAGNHGVATPEQVAAARLGTEHLIALGHREIYHLAGPAEFIESDARTNGYLQAMSEANLAAHTALGGDWSAESGFRAISELVARRRIDGIVAGNDQMAIGAMAAIIGAGLEVPGDVSVVGFDDIPEARFLNPPLTTIRQDFDEIGEHAVEALLDDIRGLPATPRPAQSFELVVRGSTAPRARGHRSR